MRRTCVGCRQVQDKAAMLRLVVDKDGWIWPDFLAALPGRGFYLCLRVSCLQGMSDKRLQALKRDFSPQLPQWQVLRLRLFDMLQLRLKQLFSSMRRQAVVGRDAVMHCMWGKQPLLILLAEDAGCALVRQVEDAVQKRDASSQALHTRVVKVGLDAKVLGSMLGRGKVSVVAFLQDSPQEKLQQLCVWQQNFVQAGLAPSERKSKVTNGE